MREIASNIDKSKCLGQREQVYFLISRNKYTFLEFEK